MFDFSGRVALITGSSRGIGYAAAQALGLLGATVVLNGRDAATLGQAAETLRSQGVDAHELPFDIADVGQATPAVDEVLDKLGRIGIFFSNAARKSVVSGKRWSVSVVLGGHRLIKKKRTQ